MIVSVSRYEYETKRNSNAIQSAITEFDFVFVHCFQAFFFVDFSARV